MSIDFDKALGVHPEALKLRAERTRILAANIANESTPGYQARDIDFSATLQESLQSAAGEPTLDDGGAGAALYRVPYHATADGNTVELGVEQAAFAQNAQDFQASLAFINLQLKGLAKVIAG
jgi:flagellar basal-body rod protein FlgB